MSESLSCSFYLKVDKPINEVFDAVYLGEHISSYFCTGSTSGNLDEGATVMWAFHDFPEMPAFPVEVVKCVRNETICLKWGSAIEGEINDVEIVFEKLDNPNQTLVRVTESGWPRTEEGIQGCTGNCGGWSNMLACLKVYLELGVKLRQFMF